MSFQTTNGDAYSSRNILFDFQNNKTLSSQNKQLLSKNISAQPITMYYYLYEPSGNVLNASETLFVTNPQENTYRGITNRFMSNSSYDSYTSDIMTYISCRTPKSSDPGAFDKDMYNEYLTINSAPYQENFIQAVANYIDDSESYETTVPDNNFVVTAATGKYKNYKNINITYDNVDPRKTRIVQIM